MSPKSKKRENLNGRKEKTLWISWIFLLVVLGNGLVLSRETITTAEEQPAEKEAGTLGSTNPASGYCDKLGYKFEDGECIFPDGTKCKAWDFFRGEYGQKFTYCERQGFKIENRIDNMGSWTSEYAVCVFPDGSECLEQDYFDNKCNRLECKKWNMSEGGCIRFE